MFCRNCGTEIPEGNGFCEICGAPVRASKAADVPKKAENESSLKKTGAVSSGGKTGSVKGRFKKKYKILVAVIVAVVAVGVGGFTVYNTSTVNAEYNQKLETANKFLSDGDYESAIETFTAMIEIKPKREEAYLGLADIYISKGNYVEAEKIIAKGEENSGSDEIKKKSRLIKAYTANDEYLRKLPLAKVDETYKRGENDGGLISSLAIDENADGPRWLDISMNDANRELSITIRENKNGKIDELDTLKIPLGVIVDGSNMLGARYDLYTATGGEKNYLCIGSYEIPYPDYSLTRIRVIEIGEKSLKQVKDYFVSKSIGYYDVGINDKLVAKYESEDDAAYEDFIKGVPDDLKKISEDAKESLGVDIRFKFDKTESSIDINSMFYDDERDSCDKHVSYIQFGKFSDDRHLDGFDTNNYTIIKDYTNLRERLASGGGDKKSDVDLSSILKLYGEEIRSATEPVMQYDDHKSVALCDINGDKIPELLYFNGIDEYGKKILKMRTVENGKIKTISYDFGHELSEDGEFRYDNVSWGPRYKLFIDSHDRICLEAVQGGAEYGDYIMRAWEIDKKGNVQNTYEWSYTVGWEPGEEETNKISNTTSANVYKVGEEKKGKTDPAECRKDYAKQVGDVRDLIFNLSDEGDGPVAMDFREFLDYVDENTQ